MPFDKFDQVQHYSDIVNLLARINPLSFLYGWTSTLYRTEFILYQRSV